jgi:hypothetical protein
VIRRWPIREPAWRAKFRFNLTQNGLKMAMLRTKMSDFSPFEKGSEKNSVFYCFSIRKTKNQGKTKAWFSCGSY